VITVRPVHTDAQGEYRLAAIPPGGYFLRASRKTVFTYYPGVAQSDEAIPIKVEAGADLRAIDFSIASISPFKVSGRIVNPFATGEHTPYDSFLVSRNTRLRNEEDSVLIDQDAANNRFEFQNVAPGSYDLYIGHVGEDIGSNWSYAGHAAFDVLDRDVTNLTVTIQQGIDIAGDVRLDDGAAKVKPQDLPLPSFIVLDGLPLLSAPNATRPIFTRESVESRQGFTIPHVTRGRYRLNFNYLPDAYYVSAARLGAQDILGQAFEVNDDTSGPLVIELRRLGATLQGVVAGKDGASAAGATVYLLPVTARREDQTAYKKVRADAGGRFIISGIAPGAYTAFAFSFSRNPFLSAEVMNSEFMTPYLNFGVSVDLPNGETVRRDLTAISIRP
jgi:hypothetical protein